MMFSAKTDYRRYYENAKGCKPEDLQVVDRLLRAGALPLIKGPELATFFGLSPGALNDIVRDPDVQYRRFYIAKRNGGRRQICAPRGFLRALQRRIYESILKKVKVHPAACGYVAGGCTWACAKPHSRKKFLWNIDLCDFFPSISSQRVTDAFMELGYPRKAAVYLTRLCTIGGRLPQGAPTSPALTNLVFRSADSKLAGLCEPQRIVYTRYADDLSFSSNKPISPEFQAEVRAVLEAEGFRINAKKSRLLGPACQRTVVGLVINKAVSIPRKRRREIRALFHRFRLKPEAFDDRIDNLLALANWVAGLHRQEGRAYIRLLKRAGR
jgi:RNA-directed DNA polymerase